jgi:hypothetical protein
MEFLLNKSLVAFLLVVALQLSPSTRSATPLSEPTIVNHPSAQVLSFLAGHWLAVTPTEKTIELTWAPEHRGTMIGTQRTWQSGKLKSYEFLFVREAKYGPYMRVNVFDEHDQEDLQSLPPTMGVNSYQPNKQAELVGHNAKLGNMTFTYELASHDHLILTIAPGMEGEERKDQQVIDFRRTDLNDENSLPAD